MFERDVRDTLREAPSPDFLARARMRNAEARMAHHFTLRWALWGAAAATVVFLLTVLFVPQEETPQVQSSVTDPITGEVLKIDVTLNVVK